MSILEWRNEAQTILARVDGAHTDIIEPGHPEWDALSAADGIAPFLPEPAQLWPSSADVNAERNRRMRGTFIFRGTSYNCDSDSLQRITGAGTLAAVAINGGAQEGDLRWHGGQDPFEWIAADNSVVPMDAQTCFAFGQAAAKNESLHIFAARALKDMTPIPEDFADDKWWP